MSDLSSVQGQPANVADAVVKSRKDRGVSPIWIIPIVALLIGLYLVYELVASSGPTITIHFAGGFGVEG